MVGGEIYVKKIPSMNIMEVAEAVSENIATNVVGIRPGEKLHEQMIGKRMRHLHLNMMNTLKFSL